MEDQEASSLRFDDINNCEVDNQVDGADNCFAINNLPHLIFVNILSYLSVEDLGSASSVSKYWYNSCLDPQLWKIIKLKKRRKVDDKVLGRVTNHGSNASVLDVSECPNITEDGLIKALWRCRLLVELTVVRCSAVTDECLSVIGKSCKKIKSLDITLCSVTDKGLQEFGKSCTRLEKLIMDQCRSLTSESLCSVARSCPMLRWLSVEYDNLIGDEGVHEMVQSCPSLERLQLNSCGITSQTAVYIAQYCKNMSVLDLRRCSTLTDDMVEALVNSCQYLKLLNLSLCFHVTDTSLKYIVSKCRTLRSLYMVHCKITDDGLEAFLHCVCNLERLDISWCQDVTDKGVQTVLKGCPYLKHLGLVRCDLVNDETITDLTKQFPKVFLSTVLTEMNEMCKRAGCIPFFKP